MSCYRLYLLWPISRLGHFGTHGWQQEARSSEVVGLNEWMVHGSKEEGTTARASAVDCLFVQRRRSQRN